MNVLLRFPCPKCKKGFISDRQQIELDTDKINLMYQCYHCGYTLTEYILGD